MQLVLQPPIGGFQLGYELPFGVHHLHEPFLGEVQTELLEELLEHKLVVLRKLLSNYVGLDETIFLLVLLIEVFKLLPDGFVDPLFGEQFVAKILSLNVERHLCVIFLGQVL